MNILRGISQETTSFSDVALETFFSRLPLRLQHMRDVAFFAADMTDWALWEEDFACSLRRAALLHDVGYAPDLHRSGFHPLDGAFAALERGEHPLVVHGILHHSWAAEKAARTPSLAAQYAQFSACPQAEELVEAVTIADWRACGVGGRVSFAGRLLDIVRRHPGDVQKEKSARTMCQAVTRSFVRWAAALASRNQPLPWVFSDVDNTLLCPGKPFSQENRSAIAAYEEAGGRFSLATGKHPLAMLLVYKELCLRGSLIAANGTALLENGRVRVLAHLGEKALPLLARLRALGVPTALYRETGLEAGAFWDEDLDAQLKYYHELPAQRTSLPGPVLKVLSIAPGQDAVLDRTLRDIAAELGLVACRSAVDFLEFLPAQSGKGQALRTVMQEAHWPILHSVAVGDTENDESMCAQAGLCVAVENASAGLRAYADVLAPSCAAHGVGWLLETLRTGKGWTAFLPLIGKVA